MSKTVLGFVGLLALCSFSASGLTSKAPPKLSNERIIFHTNVGDIVFALFPEIAPKTTAKILKLVKAGAYDGVPIGRVEKGFVAQVFNYDARTTPLTPEQLKLLGKIPAEFSDIRHTRGIVSLAREDNDINSGEFSFSFLLGEAPHLDHQYTVFGEVTQGMDVLSGIENIPTEKTVPIATVMVERAEVVNVDSLNATQLQGVRMMALPYEKGKFWFEVFAAVMFTLTVATPIYKSIGVRRST